MLLSKKRNDPASVVVSICGQCHLRGGKSRSTGLPYPNNFVAGDNLFRDFAVDFSDERLAALNPADRHVLENVRDVVVRGEDKLTCLSCHKVHEQSSDRHRRAGNRTLCTSCHNPAGPKSAVKRYDVHSETCEY
jgi:predicted CXXCH cytochrome family protein